MSSNLKQRNKCGYFYNKIILSIMFTFTISISFSQNWEMVNEGQNYKIEKGHTICKSNQGYDYDYVVMKFTNKTNEELTLNYVMEAWYGENCSGCNDPDKEKYAQITIPANSSIEGNCTTRNRDLKVFHHSITVHPNAFKGKLTDIKITKVFTNK